MGYVTWASADNGDIPASKMVDVDGARRYLNPNAAAAFHDWDAAYFARTGIHITISEAFRDIAEQERLYALYRSGRGYVAAVPHTSSHGEGLAVDVNSWVYSARQELHDILEETGKAHGWSWTLVGRPSGEAWHFNYVGDPTVDFSKLSDFVSRLTQSLSALGDDMALVHAIIQNSTPNVPSYGSTAVIGPGVPGGYLETSFGLASRAEFNAWTAIEGAVTGVAPTIRDVDESGWELAKRYKH